MADFINPYDDPRQHTFIVYQEPIGDNGKTHDHWVELFGPDVATKSHTQVQLIGDLGKVSIVRAVHHCRCLSMFFTVVVGVRTILGIRDPTQTSFTVLGHEIVVSWFHRRLTASAQALSLPGPGHFVEAETRPSV
jgi:hypothetical protein